MNGTKRLALAGAYGLHVLTVLTALVFLAVPVAAQDDGARTPEPLVVPFTLIPPFMQLRHDDELHDEGEPHVKDERSGFIVELSELIGAEIGVPIEYLDVANSREFVAAQISGRSQMIAGVLQLPPLAATNSFSVQVASDELIPTVLAQDLERLSDGAFTGIRIAVVPPAAGSDHTILEQNIRVEVDSPHAALMKLLARQVDAVLLPPPIVYALARDAGVDGRIAFLGESLQSATRHVALHESRAELLGPINEAIALFESDGRLEQLRRRHNLAIPAPPPDVLKVGVALIPAFASIDADGELTGFNVEAMTALAENAGLKIQFEQLPVSQWVKGPEASGMDINAMLTQSPERLVQMDFSNPITERVLAVIVRTEYGEDPTELNDLADQRIGVRAGTIFERRAKALGSVQVFSYETEGDYIAAMDAGDLDAIFTETRIAEGTLEDFDRGQVYKVIALEDETITTGVALRFGLGNVRDRLNAVIQGYVLSDEYAALQEKYFGTPVFWTPTRIYAALAAAGTAFFGLLGFMGSQAYRRQERKFEFLDQVVANMKSQVMLVSNSNEILYTNSGNRARPETWAARITKKNAYFDEAITDLTESGEISISGKTPEETRDLLISSRFQDGAEIEYQHAGRRFSRSTWQLEDGTALIIRDDVTAHHEQLEREKTHAAELGKLVSELERSNRELDEFAYIASHDMKEPLRGLSINANFLMREDLPEPLRKRTVRMHELAIRMEKLIGDLFAFSRLGRGNLAPVEVSPRDVIKDIRSTLSEWLAETGGEIVELGEIPTVKAQPVHVKTILQNLIVNGITYSDAEVKRVEVGFTPQVEVNGQTLENAIFVKDNGIGIDDRFREKVFRIFSRLNKEAEYVTGSGAGTGSGLAFVRKIVEEHGGVIEFDSEPGQGSTFYFTLPLAGARERSEDV